MTIDPEDYSEAQVRVRPGRGSRPRTKQRPTHAGAAHGQITGVARGRYRVRLGGFLADQDIDLDAIRARELHGTAIVVGDRVRLTGDVSGASGALARIVAVEPRRTVLRRSADDRDQLERIVVANADLLLIVCAAAAPKPRPGFVDRCVLAAVDGGLDPALIITKTDLDPAVDLAAHADRLGIPCIRTAPPTEAETMDAGPTVADLADLRSLISGRVAALVGHSGVGKSSLLNRLAPTAQRATGAVNRVTGRGRHTSSSASAVACPATDGLEPAWLIDTAGVRSFGLGHVDPDRFARAWAGPAGARIAAAEPELRDDLVAEAEDPSALPRLRELVRLLALLEPAPDDAGH